MEQVSRPTELLSLMASTSVQIDFFSDSIIQSVKEGEVNPLDVCIQLKAMELATDRIRKEIHENLMNEVNKFPEKEFEWRGNKISKAEHGTKYDYSKCGDPDLTIYLESKEKIDMGIKDRETFLKALKEPIEVLHSLTGEVHLLTPPTKKSKSGINVSIR